MIVLPAPALALLSAGNVVCTDLIEISLVTQTLRYNTSPVNLEWAGEEWTGRGQVVSIGEVVSKETGEATGQSYTLNAISSANVALAFLEDVQGRLITQYVALCDPESHAVQYAFLVYSGLLDRPTISDSEGSAVITFNSESTALQRNRAKLTTYSDADQRAKSPADGSMRFVAAAASEPIVWPSREYYF